MKKCIHATHHLKLFIPYFHKARGEPWPKPNAHVFSTGTALGSSRQFTGTGTNHMSDPNTMIVTWCHQVFTMPLKFAVYCILLGVLSLCFHTACGEPSPKPNAHLLSVGTTLGSTRQYNCNDGHVLSEASDPDTMTVTCLASGAWTATNFQCVAGRYYH